VISREDALHFQAAGRLTIDGRLHRKSCQVVLAPGVVVRTDE